MFQAGPPTIIWCCMRGKGVCMCVWVSGWVPASCSAQSPTDRSEQCEMSVKRSYITVLVARETNNLEVVLEQKEMGGCEAADAPGASAGASVSPVRSDRSSSSSKPIVTISKVLYTRCGVQFRPSTTLKHSRRRKQRTYVFPQAFPDRPGSSYVAHWKHATRSMQPVVYTAASGVRSGR